VIHNRLSRALVGIALFFLFDAGRIGALDIYLAPVIYQDDESVAAADEKHPGDDLHTRLFAVPIADGVAFHDAEVQGDSVPRTFLEAASLCESQGYPYLLYGFVKRTGYSYYAELKLMERQRKDLAVSFISGDDDSHYERLLDDLSTKITSYVRTDLGMGSPRPQERAATNIVVLPMALGYWTPMGGSWSQAAAGLVTADASVRFIPSRPLFQLWTRPCFLALGVDLEYALGASQPGVESFFLHVAKVRLPVEAYMDFAGGHRIGFGLGPLLEVDTMAKAKQYGSTVIETTVVPGATFSVRYDYVLSRTVVIGLANIFDLALYAQPFFTYSPRLTVEIWLGQPG
jgi:hypothetical protein